MNLAAKIRSQSELDVDEECLEVVCRIVASTGNYPRWVRGIQSSSGAAILLVVATPDSEVTRETISRRFGLTPREAEVCQLLARRLKNREISEFLGIAESTARRHTERILRKLGISSREDVRSVVARCHLLEGLNRPGLPGDSSV